MDVAVLGTGTMGAPMAANIAAAGHRVRVWNRTSEKANAVEGGEAVAAPAEAVAEAEIVVTMLTDGRAVEEVMREALERMPDGAVWVQMSTVGIEAIEQLARLAGERGVAFVDAPVLGTKQPAEQGQLIVLASGPAEARERAGPVFDAVGAKTLDLGEAGEGTRLKLVINAWIVALMGGLAETIAFAESIGVDPKRFLETIDGAPMGTPYAQLKGAAMVEREFPPAFALAGARKDARLVVEAAERAGLEATLTRTIGELFDVAIEKGHGDEDMAAALYAYIDGK
jgi:3-hydroxyisobutyrate dehydrogenase